MNISLPDSLKDWAQRKAKNSDYSNASDFVRSVLRAEKEREEAFWQDVEELVLEGINSGEPVEYTPEYRKALRVRLREKLQQQTKHRS